jgi:hypothetical protein
LKAVNGVRNSDMRNFFLICFSSLAKKVSLADPRLTVPVRHKKEQYPEDHFLAEKTKNHLNQLKRINVQNVFFEIVSQNIKRISTLEVLKKTDSESELICSDAKQLLYEFASRKRSLPDKSIQLIITSPPYVGAQKYIRSVSLNLGWIGMCNADQLKDYKYASIGLEEFHKSEYLSQPITGITVYVIY